MPRTSRIYVLDIYDDGSVRLDGRLQKSDLDANIIHSVMLPKNSCISIAIIRCCHKNVAHAGRRLTLNELSHCGFRIVSTSTVISSLIHEYVLSL